MSEIEKLNIYQKLSNIQAELKVPKNQLNKFGNYKYRSGEDILEAAKPIARKNGAVLTVSDRVNMLGVRYYIEATALLTDVETKEFIAVTASAREEDTKKGMDSSQITGSASSYARKYALNGLFDIDDTKDSDATNTGEDEKEVEFKLATKEQKELIEKTYGDKLTKLLDSKKLVSMGKMTYEVANEIITELKDKGFI